MMPLNHATPAFEKRCASDLKHVKLQGLQPKEQIEQVGSGLALQHRI